MSDHKQCPPNEAPISNMIQYGSISSHEAHDVESEQQQDSTMTPVLSSSKRVQAVLLTFGVTLFVISIFGMVLFHHSNGTSMIDAPSIALTQSYVQTESNTGLDSSSNTESLMDIFHHSSTIIHPQNYIRKSVKTFPEISVDFEHDRKVDNGYTTTEEISVTISWTLGRLSNKDDLLDSYNDVIAAQCGDNENHFRYIDIKTLHDASISTTISDNSRLRRSRRLEGWHYGSSSDWWTGGSGIIHGKHWRSSTTYDEDGWHVIRDTSNDDEYDHDDEWQILSVPQSILQQRKCQFVIYHMINDHEYVLVSKSSIIQF